MKECKKCEQSLPFDKFHKCNSKKDKLQRYCKECMKEQVSKRFANKEEETGGLFIVFKNMYSRCYEWCA